MRESDEQRDNLPEFPNAARTAGILWILFGVFGLATLLVVFLLLAAATPAGARIRGPGSLGAIVPILFLVLGWQTVSGNAAGTARNGILSLLFGCLYLAFAVLVLVLAPGTLDDGGLTTPKMIAIGIVILLFAAILLLAGVLALKARTQYDAWYTAWLRYWATIEEEELEAERRRERRERRDDD